MSLNDKDPVHDPDIETIDLDAPRKPDACFDALADAPFFSGGLGGTALTWIYLERMREYLHIHPKGHPGRPKGTWKRVPPKALTLWKQGMPPAEICSELNVPYDERKSFKSALGSATRRLPRGLRKEVLGPLRRAWHNRKRTAPPTP